MKRYYHVNVDGKVTKTPSLHIARSIAGKDGEIRFNGRWLVE